MQVRYNKLAKRTKYEPPRSLIKRFSNAYFIFTSMFFGLGFYKSFGGWKYTLGYILYVYKKGK